MWPAVFLWYVQQPGFDLSRNSWSLLNCYWTVQGLANLCRWGLVTVDLYACCQQQTVIDVINLCPLTELMGGLPSILGAGNAAVHWLENMAATAFVKWSESRWLCGIYTIDMHVKPDTERRVWLDGWLCSQPVPLTSSISMPAVLITRPTVKQNLPFLLYWHYNHRQYSYMGMARQSWPRQLVKFQDGVPANGLSPTC